MTSAAYKSAGMGGRSAERQGYGLVVFAAVLLAVIGCFNLIYGIAAIANAHVFVANAHYVFGNLRAWGWITLIIGVVQLLAAAGVFTGNQLARWFGVAVLGLNAIDQMFFLRLPVLVADHHRHGRGRAVGVVRLRQPPEHRSGRLMRTVETLARAGPTHGA